MDPAVVIMGWALALPVIALAIYKLNKTVDERMVPFMAILAAGIFVAQMLNFPIGGGTTGHLIGAALAVVLLGLYGGILVMTTILVIQCLIFGDGGADRTGTQPSQHGRGGTSGGLWRTSSAEGSQVVKQFL